MTKNIAFILALFLIQVAYGQCNLEQLTLNKYRPKSIYNIPLNTIETPAHPIIDMHSHDYANNEVEIQQWVETMDKFGIEKTVILSMKTGAGFDSVVSKYAKYSDRFDIWCGIDFTGYDSDEVWVQNAILELERCYQMGAHGIGELGDKGEGLIYSKPTPAYGIHLDDSLLIPLFAKCAELNMPVNVHIAEPKWMYEEMDSTNDGLMNGYSWRIDKTKKDILLHHELIQTLNNALANNPKTKFIACHFANCSYDLAILGKLLDKHPNLWADNAARYAETAPIPRFVNHFYEKYQDRLIYGTDMGFDEEMYKITFRILETSDEHFYETDLFNYHWPLYGINLSDEILKKLYKDNSLLMLKNELYETN